MILWIIVTVFIFLDSSGIFHILPSMDDLLIGKTAKANYANNEGLKVSLLFVLFVFLLLLMVCVNIFYIKYNKYIYNIYNIYVNDKKYLNIKKNI